MASTMGPTMLQSPKLSSHIGVVWLSVFWITSGGHSRECCVNFGFRKVGGWVQCYFHPTLEVVLSIYVDDSKMPAPEQEVDKAWNVLETNIRLDPPIPIGT